MIKKKISSNKWQTCTNWICKKPKPPWCHSQCCWRPLLVLQNATGWCKMDAIPCIVEVFSLYKVSWVSQQQAAEEGQKKVRNNVAVLWALPGLVSILKCTYRSVWQWHGGPCPVWAVKRRNTSTRMLLYHSWVSREEVSLSVRVLFA